VDFVLRPSRILSGSVSKAFTLRQTSKQAQYARIRFSGHRRLAWGNVVIGVMKSDQDSKVDTGNKRVLADTFCSLARYALRKTRRDVAAAGVTPAGFSVEAMDTSLAAGANAGIFVGQAARPVKTLLEKVLQAPLIFQFRWTAPNTGEPMVAAFELSHQPDGDLKVRLLWLGLPERIPIARAAAAAGGSKPLEEAVAELLRVLEDGRLAPYAPPA
jgi:hypothetical protein